MTRKSNFGHYTVLLHSNRGPKYMNEAASQSGMRGIMKKYYWGELEPEKGKYDFTAIAADLAWADKEDMQYVLMIEDKTFKDERPCPPYLDWVTVPNRPGGYTILRFHNAVVARYKALTTALGNRFDDHPKFEGICQQETSLGVDTETLFKWQYTPERYRDALIASFKHVLGTMPRSRMFWYQNFFFGNQSYIGSVAGALASDGLVMAGPDVMPDRTQLVKRSYPYFDMFQTQMPMGIQCEDICYHHAHATDGYETQYWTPEELFVYARDRLHVDYMFWVRIPEERVDGAYDWYDALPVIAANPSFSGGG